MQISALNAGKGKSHYLISKGDAEGLTISERRARRKARRKQKAAAEVFFKGRICDENTVQIMETSPQFQYAQQWRQINWDAIDSNPILNAQQKEVEKARVLKNHRIRIGWVLFSTGVLQGVHDKYLLQYLVGKK